VGDVDSVDPTILRRLLAEGLIPVLSTIGSDAVGQAYNINADTVAGAVAGALGAEKVVYLTDVTGILDVHGELIPRIDAAQLDGLVADGTVSGGMIPKVAACLHAVRSGAGSAHVLDGRLPHVLLLEIFTDEGVGTMITGKADT
jgi:acetylglutamate kinase